MQYMSYQKEKCIIILVWFVRFFPCFWWRQKYASGLSPWSRVRWLGSVVSEWAWQRDLLAFACQYVNHTSIKPELVYGSENCVAYKHSISYSAGSISPAHTCYLNIYNVHKSENNTKTCYCRLYSIKQLNDIYDCKKIIINTIKY